MNNCKWTVRGQREPYFWEVVDRALTEQYASYSWLGVKLGAHPATASMWKREQLRLRPEYRVMVLNLLSLSEADVTEREEVESRGGVIKVEVQVDGVMYTGELYRA